MSGQTPMSGQAPRSVDGGLWFELTVDGTCELARGAEQAAALVQVTARRGDRGAAMAAGIAQVIVMDRSQSMRRQGKLQQARHAAMAAIDALSESTYFAVVAGNHDAELVYPPDGVLRQATADAKRAARSRVADLDAIGGTAMSGWLRLAKQLFDQVPDAVRHAVLYTDGINESEQAAVLDAALGECRDLFVCDVRGIGTDWQPQELRRIADGLQGEVKAIIDVADLRVDLIRLMEHAQSLLVPQAYLRLSLDRHFRLESVRQIRPTQNDLTDRAQPQRDGKTDVPLLAWGEESRDYLVRLGVEPGTPTGEEMRAARIDVVAAAPGGGPLRPCASPAAMIVRWLPYGDSSRYPNGTTEAHDAMRMEAAEQAGAAAYEHGDTETALRDFTVAIGLARSLGAVGHLERLQRLVITDELGMVRLRPDITAADLRILDAHSTHHRDTTFHPERRKPAAQEPQAGQSAAAWRPRPAEVSRTCPNGHVTTGAVVKHCEELDCGYDFSDDFSDDDD
jgi:Mg-chelatase subunit ChlD